MNKKPYELTYIISDNLDEKEAAKTAEKVKKLLPDGQIKNENFWGRRKLAYPIKKRESGYYVTLELEAEPEKIATLDSKLKSEEAIIRHLIVKTKPQPPKASKVPVKEVEKKEVKKEVAKKVSAKKPAPKRATKAVKIAKEIELEDKKMKTLEEKLEEILKE